MKKKFIPYIFITPFFTLFILFLVYPILESFYLSFHEVKGLKNIFVGLENYKLVLTDKIFWQSILNVFIILALQVPIMILLATIFATMLNSETLKFKGLFRLFIFLPVLIDLVTYSIVFSVFFNEHFGIINHLLSLIHIPPIYWISNYLAAKILIVIAITWRWTGYNTIIILSGLQSIDKSLYEFADIEGAGKITRLFKITLPLLKPIMLFCAIMSTIGTIQLFTEPMILTNGGPSNSTLTPIMYLYSYGFKNFKFGYASAIAYVITTIVFVMSIIQIKLTKGGE
ncbi:carbohydrate ABC transporter permease [Oceanivirga salmonicida]|uniref:carbohydrate ABC transporter permease n=1 Tax=Oceanivirga salmonicida TaxID=1769291 RepID=UPI00082CCBB9|nr:sugar ABC transporter permease [Oceanivirga salmonicida]